MVRDQDRTDDRMSIETVLDEIEGSAHPLRTREDLNPLIERIGDASFVLLGEASHGTSEYYQWRARLSSRLIAEKGFNFVAVEGDWPDCYRLNRYVKRYPEAGANARDVRYAVNRCPTWMWANREIAAFAEWMRRYNLSRSGSSSQLDVGERSKMPCPLKNTNARSAEQFLKRSPNWTDTPGRCTHAMNAECADGHCIPKAN